MLSSVSSKISTSCTMDDPMWKSGSPAETPFCPHAFALLDMQDQKRAEYFLEKNRQQKPSFIAEGDFTQVNSYSFPAAIFQIPLSQEMLQRLGKNAYKGFDTQLVVKSFQDLISADDANKVREDFLREKCFFETTLQGESAELLSCITRYVDATEDYVYSIRSDDRLSSLESNLSAAVKAGHLSEKKKEELLYDATLSLLKTLYQFHKAGFSHEDIDYGNVLYELDQQYEKIHIRLIDFATFQDWRRDICSQNDQGKIDLMKYKMLEDIKKAEERIESMIFPNEKVNQVLLSWRNNLQMAKNMKHADFLQKFQEIILKVEEILKPSSL